MEKTIATFIISRPFVQGNRYSVSMNHKEVVITTTRSPYLVDMNRVQVTIEFASHFRQDSVPEAIKRECVLCLNRLIDVVRYKTQFYLIERVTEHDIFLFNFKIIKEDGKTRVGGAMNFGGPYFPLDSIPETIVESEISKMLMDESSIVPFYENLRLDSFHYFSTRQFNVSVIIANIALESIVADHLFNKLIMKGLSSVDADSTIEHLFSLKRSGGEKGGLHRVMSKDFEAIDGRCFKSSNLWKKFEVVRTRRKNVIHPYTTELDEQTALQTIKDVMEIIDWIRLPEGQNNSS